MNVPPDYAEIATRAPPAFFSAHMNRFGLFNKTHSAHSNHNKKGNTGEPASCSPPVRAEQRLAVPFLTGPIQEIRAVSLLELPACEVALLDRPTNTDVQNAIGLDPPLTRA